MNYIVIELQTTNGATAHIVSAYSDRNAAENKFHAVMAAAAISAVEVHACAMLTEDGKIVRQECYRHPVEPAPEPEPEEETE